MRSLVLIAFVWVALACARRDPGASVAPHAPLRSAHPIEGALSIMSLNIRWNAPGDGVDRWENRRATLIDTIGQVDADLLSLQEVTPEQWIDLQKLLRRSNALRARDANTVAAFSDDFELVRTATLALPGDYPRAALIAELRIDGRPLTFGAVHFGGSAAQIERSALLTLEAFARFPRPWIIAGDFNTLPYRFDEWPADNAHPELARARSHAYDLFLDAGFVDGFRALHPGSIETSVSGFAPSSAREAPLRIDGRIDWILATAELAWINCAFLESSTPARRPISDHRAMVARLQLPRR